MSERAREREYVDRTCLTVSICACVYKTVWRANFTQANEERLNVAHYLSHESGYLLPTSVSSSFWLYRTLSSVVLLFNSFTCLSTCVRNSWVSLQLISLLRLRLRLQIRLLIRIRIRILISIRTLIHIRLLHINLYLDPSSSSNLYDLSL